MILVLPVPYLGDALPGGGVVVYGCVRPDSKDDIISSCSRQAKTSIYLFIFNRIIVYMLWPKSTVYHRIFSVSFPVFIFF